jgi:hypothetical protein
MQQINFRAKILALTLDPGPKIGPIVTKIVAFSLIFILACLFLSDFKLKLQHMNSYLGWSSLVIFSDQPKDGPKVVPRSATL